jgi:hypothetical protein
MLAHAITAGHQLNEAQKIIDHGRRDKGLKENLGEIKSPVGTRRYMRPAEHEEDIKPHWPHVTKMTDGDGRNSIRATDKLTAELEAERNTESKRSPKNILARPEKVAAAVRSVADGPARDEIVKAIKNANLASRDRRKNARASDDTPEWSWVDQATDIADKFGQDQLKKIAEFAIGRIREIEETPQAAE